MDDLWDKALDRLQEWTLENVDLHAVLEEALHGCLRAGHNLRTMFDLDGIPREWADARREYDAAVARLRDVLNE